MILGFDFDRLRSGPFEGPAIVKPPALPGDTYWCNTLMKGLFLDRGLCLTYGDRITDLDRLSLCVDLLIAFLPVLP